MQNPNSNALPDRINIIYAKVPYIYIILCMMYIIEFAHNVYIYIFVYYMCKMKVVNNIINNFLIYIMCCFVLAG